MLEELLVSTGFAALHVDDAVARSDQVAGYALQGDQGPDRLHPVGVPREAAPQPQNGFSAPGDGVSEEAHGLFRHARDPLNLLEGPRFRGGAQDVEAADVIRDELPGMQDVTNHAQGQCAVGTRPWLDVRCAQVGGGCGSHVHIDDPDPFCAGHGQPAGIGRVGLGDVRPPEQECVGVQDFVDGRRGVRRAEHEPKRCRGGADAAFARRHDVGHAEQVHEQQRREFALPGIPERGHEDRAMVEGVRMVRDAPRDLFRDHVHGRGVGDA